jgi:hypothetical protein
MKLHFGYLIGLVAVSIATCAGYFSVVGLGQLFAGASLQVMIMATTLELGKLVTASYLERKWKSIKLLNKIYGVLAVFVLAIITSSGIYGYLSNAYQKTANEYQELTNNINVINTKKGYFEDNLISYDDVIKTKKGRLESLVELRNKQETRLDDLVSNEHWYNANRTRNEITSANNEIIKLNSEIDGIILSKQSINDSISSLNFKIIELESTSKASAELGPVKYISSLLEKDMDEVVNIYIILLVLVFDPLSIVLIISTNSYFKDNEEDGKKGKSDLLSKKSQKPKNKDIDSKKNVEINKPITPIEYEEVEEMDSKGEVSYIMKPIETASGNIANKLMGKIVTHIGIKTDTIDDIEPSKEDVVDKVILKDKQVKPNMVTSKTLKGRFRDRNFSKDVPERRKRND